jgi:hypothetical protein
MMEPSRTNALLEVLATCLSFQVLDDLQRRWAQSPHDEHWRRFAPQFGSYRANAISSQLNQLDQDIRDHAAARRWSSVASFLKQRW